MLAVSAEVSIHVPVFLVKRGGKQVMQQPSARGQRPLHIPPVTASRTDRPAWTCQKQLFHRHTAGRCTIESL